MANDVLNLEPLSDKFRAFGWHVVEVDGHNHLQLVNAFAQRQEVQPLVIIAHTIKGKGVDFMENTLRWHYSSPNEQQLEEALKQLS